MIGAHWPFVARSRLPGHLCTSVRKTVTLKTEASPFSPFCAFAADTPYPSSPSNGLGLDRTKGRSCQNRNFMEAIYDLGALLCPRVQRGP